MASLRRSKTLPTDGATAKFLYTILKQLDLKSIDWQLVATALEITNGHAARMRFSRFKQAMEGVVPAPRRRTPASTASRVKKPKGSTSKTSPMAKKRGLDEIKKNADDEDEEGEPAKWKIKREVKEEGREEGMPFGGVASTEEPSGMGGLVYEPAEQMGNMTLAPMMEGLEAPDSTMGEEMSAYGGGYLVLDAPTVKKEPVVKVEPIPGWDD